MGNAFNVTGSAFDGYAFILLVFRLTGLSSFCLGLGLVRQIDWKLTLVIFFLANLFNIVIFTEYNRSGALVVNALLMARLLAARSSRGQVIGAGLLGLLAVLLGLYTTDLGLYSLLAGVVVLAGFSGLAWWWPQMIDLGSARRYLRLLGTFVGTYLAGNLLVSLVFKLTSVNYNGLFDYQLFSLRIV